MELNQIQNLVSFVLLFHPAHNNTKILNQSPDYIYEKYRTFISAPISIKKFKKTKNYEKFLNEYLLKWHSFLYDIYGRHYEYDEEVYIILQFLYEILSNKKYGTPIGILEKYKKFFGDYTKINKNNDGYYSLHQLFRSDLLKYYIELYNREIKIIIFSH